MSLYQKDSDYADGRLSDTIVMIEGSPVLIYNVDCVMDIAGYNLLSRREVSHQGEEIDLTPIEMGYVNGKDGATYLARLPQRRWKQGLTTKGLGVVGDSRLDRHLEMSDGLLECIMDDYPTLRETIIYTRERQHTVAFAKHWAISPRQALFFRGVRVGWVSSWKCKFSEEYSYLKELLEETLC